MSPDKEILVQLYETNNIVAIAKQYGVASSTVHYWFKCYGITKKPRGYWHQFIQKYDYNYEVFTRSDDVSYYLLGAFITDGCMKQGNASISSADKDWLISIRDLICKDLPITKEKSKCWRLNVRDFRIRGWLLQNGCVPRKSLVVQFPKIPTQYLPDFLRGCIDGDGSISHKRYKRYVGKNKRLYRFYSTNYTLTSASKSFIDAWSELLDTKNMGHSIYTTLPGNKTSTIDGRIIQQKNTIYSLRAASGSALSFLRWIYYPNHKVSMNRKREKAEQIFRYYIKKEKSN